MILLAVYTKQKYRAATQMLHEGYNIKTWSIRFTDFLHKLISLDSVGFEKTGPLIPKTVIR